MWSLTSSDASAVSSQFCVGSFVSSLNSGTSSAEWADGAMIDRLGCALLAQHVTTRACTACCAYTSHTALSLKKRSEGHAEHT